MKKIIVNPADLSVAADILKEARRDLLEVLKWEAAADSLDSIRIAEGMIRTVLKTSPKIKNGKP